MSSLVNCSLSIICLIWFIYTFSKTTLLGFLFADKVDLNVPRRILEDSDLLCHPFGAQLRTILTTCSWKMKKRCWTLLTSWRHSTHCEDTRGGWHRGLMQCRSDRRECRRLERWCRRTGKPRDRRIWVDATRSHFQLYRRKETPRVVWAIIDQNLQ